MMHSIMRRWRELVIFGTVAAGIVYWFSWHWKPFTQNAFVFADTRPVSPPVEGFITEIHVRNNQFVKKGEPLFGAGKRGPCQRGRTAGIAGGDPQSGSGTPAQSGGAGQ